MKALERSLITKAGHDSGWEVILQETPEKVVLGSALHAGKVTIRRSDEARWEVLFTGERLQEELEQDPALGSASQSAHPGSEAALVRLLRRSAGLSRSLPDQPERLYAQQVEAALADVGNTATEVERLVKQRVGQQVYRTALIDYWDGACAVTGITVPELLRASHAKAWADCTTDAERLDVHNGFLLCAHLDALFDRYLISFDDNGWSIVSSSLSSGILVDLGLELPFRLRKIVDKHQPYLRWHREKLRDKSGDEPAPH